MPGQTAESDDRFGLFFLCSYISIKCTQKKHSSTANGIPLMNCAYVKWYDTRAETYEERVEISEWSFKINEWFLLLHDSWSPKWLHVSGELRSTANGLTFSPPFFSFLRFLSLSVSFLGFLSLSLPFRSSHTARLSQYYSSGLHSFWIAVHH